MLEECCAALSPHTTNSKSNNRSVIGGWWSVFAVRFSAVEWWRNKSFLHTDNNSKYLFDRYFSGTARKAEAQKEWGHCGAMAKRYLYIGEEWSILDTVDGVSNNANR